MHDEILMIALVLAAALLGGRVAIRLGYPPILGELIAGILLGPPALGLVAGNEAISVLGEVGILLMLLVIGMHLDLSDLKKASVPGLLAAAGGFLVPASLGVGLMLWFGQSGMAALFVGLAMGVTSLVTKSRILVDLRILDTRVAHVLMAGALISDMAVLVVFATVIGPESLQGMSLGVALTAAGKALAFAAAAWLVGAKLLPLALRPIAPRLDRSTVLMGTMVIGLLFAWGAEAAGLHRILGAFAAGLFLDRRLLDARVLRDVERRLTTISVGTLAPFFFVSAGFEVSFGVFRTDLPLLIAVVVLATLGKVLGTALFYVFSGNGWREGLVVGAGMNGRGAVEIIIAEIALARGLIDTDVFSILVFMALSTTATVPVLLTLGVNWLRSRGELVKAGERQGALILGAGPLGRLLGRTLSSSMRVTLVDTNRANREAGESQGLEVVEGSGLDEVILERAGVAQAKRVIAATPNAEVNVLAAQQAAAVGVPDVTVLLSPEDARTFQAILSELDISVVEMPEGIAAWEHALAIGLVQESTLLVEDPVEAPRPNREESRQTLPLIVARGEERHLFADHMLLREGDLILALSRNGKEVAGAKVESGALG